jgi:hypothetical protein
MRKAGNANAAPVTCHHGHALQCAVQQLLQSTGCATGTMGRYCPAFVLQGTSSVKSTNSTNRIACERDAPRWAVPAETKAAKLVGTTSITVAPIAIQSSNASSRLLTAPKTVLGVLQAMLSHTG